MPNSYPFSFTSQEPNFNWGDEPDEYMNQEPYDLTYVYPAVEWFLKDHLGPNYCFSEWPDHLNSRGNREIIITVKRVAEVMGEKGWGIRNLQLLISERFPELIPNGGEINVYVQRQRSEPKPQQPTRLDPPRVATRVRSTISTQRPPEREERIPQQQQAPPPPPPQQQQRKVQNSSSALSYTNWRSHITDPELNEWLDRMYNRK